MHVLDRARNIAGRGNAGRPALVHRGRRDKNAARPVRGVPENPMKLGFFTMPVHPPARSYVETLKEDREAFILADRLGYTEGSCGEHLTDAAENIPNSMMFLATLLGVTSQMKVGTAVVNLPHTHPVIVASNAAMLDNLFQGRFILGIGAGVLRSDAEALGLLDADRNAMLAEAIDHVLALWAGTAPIDRKGKYWTISTVKTLWPEVGIGDVVKPLQKPHPPIAGTAGGRSPRISSTPIACRANGPITPRAAARAATRPTARTGGSRARSSSPRTTRSRGPMAATTPTVPTGST